MTRAARSETRRGPAAHLVAAAAIACRATPAQITGKQRNPRFQQARACIAGVLHDAGLSDSAIGRAIGRDRTTVALYLRTRAAGPAQQKD